MSDQHLRIISTEGEERGVGERCKEAQITCHHEIKWEEGEEAAATRYPQESESPEYPLAP